MRFTSFQVGPRESISAGTESHSLVLQYACELTRCHLCSVLYSASEDSIRRPGCSSSTTTRRQAHRPHEIKRLPRRWCSPCAYGAHRCRPTAALRTGTSRVRRRRSRVRTPVKQTRRSHQHIQLCEHRSTRKPILQRSRERQRPALIAEDQQLAKARDRGHSSPHKKRSASRTRPRRRSRRCSRMPSHSQRSTSARGRTTSSSRHTSSSS